MSRLREEESLLRTYFTGFISHKWCLSAMEHLLIIFFFGEFIAGLHCSGMLGADGNVHS